MAASTLIIKADDEVRNTHMSSKCSQLSSAKATWLKHAGRKWPNRCAIKGCGQDAVLGGHVYVNDEMATFWIIPICCEHNARDKAGRVRRKVKARTKAVEDVTMSTTCIVRQMARLMLK